MTEKNDSRYQHDIEAVGLYKAFGDHQVLRDVTLRIRHGETFAIIGCSGIGKSVFLKLVLRLLEPDKGQVLVHGHDISTFSPTMLLQLRRNVGMVFQSGALLSWLTVRENVGLGLSELGGYKEGEIDDVVATKLRMVGMDGTQHLLPEELSGGMKKRVAVARTLAMSPEMILFDEPTTGLDPIMSDNVDELIEDLKKQVQLTSIVVTHDMTSAFRIADRIGLLHEGRIEQVGTSDEIRNSDEPVVKQFIARHRRREP